MSRAGAWVAATLLAVAAKAAEERNADIRVRVRLAHDAPAGSGESVRDIEYVLREGKGPDRLTEAAPEGGTDLILVVTNCVTTAGYGIQAVLVDGGRTVPVQGRGIVWRQAALALLTGVGQYAREHEHALLRRRPDWPAVGFDFEPLTKEHEKELGARGGAVIVTEVTHGGPGGRAGLQAGDAVSKAGGRKVANAGDLARALYEAPKVLQLEVARKGARRTVTLNLP